MKYRSTYTNSSEYYSIGVDDETGTPVLEVIVTWVAWYSRFFRLTDQEFQEYPQNEKDITALARSCGNKPNGINDNRNRFIYSQKKEEN